MANESNYTMVIMHNPNQVIESFICPKCQNDDMDTLQIDDNEHVTCLYCGNEYDI